MQIVFNLPHVYKFGSNRVDDSQTLEVLCESLIGLNMVYLQNMKRRGHTVKPLYQAGVVYGRTEWWETIPALYHRGYGDCKSLTCALIAEYRFQGIASNPVHRWTPNQYGSNDFHILVELKNGFEDPSRKLGMGRNENARINI